MPWQLLVLPSALSSFAVAYTRAAKNSKRGILQLNRVYQLCYVAGRRDENTFSDRPRDVVDLLL